MDGTLDYGQVFQQTSAVALVIGIIGIVFGIPAAYICSQNIFMNGGMRAAVGTAAVLLGPLMFAIVCFLRYKKGKTHFFGLLPISTMDAWYNFARCYFEDVDVAAIKTTIEKSCGLKEFETAGTVNEKFLAEARRVGQIENQEAWAAAAKMLAAMSDKDGVRIGEKMFAP
jgi:uncharacterized membrane protein (UPF0136 family)